MDALTNLFWCIIGIAGGAIVTIINNKRKRLTRKMFTVNLISGKVSSINGLEIKYNSQSIKNLYSSTIQIKNTGNTTINNVDIPKKRPLSIYTDGIFIIDKLNIQLPNPNNDNDIHVIFDKNEKGISSSAVIDFEFIFPRQVITITLLHTGTISLGKWMIKDGKVLESNEILDENEHQNYQVLSHHILFYLIFLAFALIICIITLSKYLSIQKDIIMTTEHIMQLEEELELLKEENMESYNKIISSDIDLEVIKHLHNQSIPPIFE